MKFSVVTSFYNLPDFVQKQYSSLLNQTYQNWEWVVTDDFSEESCKDELIEISKNDFRVKYIDQKFKKEIFWNPHKYVSYDTDFVLHIGADDIINKKTLEIYKHFFSEYKNVVCLTSGGKRVNEDGQIYNFIYSESKNRVNCDFRNDILNSDLLITKCWKHIPYPILNFTPKNNLVGFIEDLNILTTLEEIGDIMVLNRNLSDITYRPDSLSNNPNWDDYNNDIEIIFSRIDRTRSNIVLPTIFDLSHNDELLRALYFLDLGNNTHSLNIIKSDITPKEKKLISKIYFEVPITFNSSKNCFRKNIFYITNENHLNFFTESIDNFINLDHLVIFCNLDFISLLKDVLKTKSVIYSWYGNDYFWLEKIGK
jgi:glycosyltransferase involved in cell wall biosynthesis